MSAERIVRAVNEQLNTFLSNIPPGLVRQDEIDSIKKAFEKWKNYEIQISVLVNKQRQLKKKLCKKAWKLYIGYPQRDNQYEMAKYIVDNGKHEHLLKIFMWAASEGDLMVVKYVLPLLIKDKQDGDEDHYQCALRLAKYKKATDVKSYIKECIYAEM